MSALLYLIAASLGADVLYGFYMVGRPRERVTAWQAIGQLALNGAFIVVIVIAAARLPHGG